MDEILDDDPSSSNAEFNKAVNPSSKRRGIKISVLLEKFENVYRQLDPEGC